MGCLRGVPQRVWLLPSALQRSSPSLRVFPISGRAGSWVWATLLLFGTLLTAVGVLGMTGIIPVMGVLIYAALAAVTFGSILAGIPFTLQYARDMVDPTIRQNPVFVRVNVLMTGVWGGIFAINFTLSYLAFAAPHAAGWIASPLTYLVLIAGIIFTIWYPGYVQKRHASASGQGGR